MYLAASFLLADALNTTGTRVYLPEQFLFILVLAKYVSRTFSSLDVNREHSRVLVFSTYLED